MRRQLLRFDRGSLRLDAPKTVPVPDYLIWDERIRAWRTEAINHLRQSATRLSLEQAKQIDLL
jgi:hypothetical protein